VIWTGVDDLALEQEPDDKLTISSSRSTTRVLHPHKSVRYNDDG
jgi:hypothetical protein